MASLGIRSCFIGPNTTLLSGTHAADAGRSSASRPKNAALLRGNDGLTSVVSSIVATSSAISLATTVAEDVYLGKHVRLANGASMRTAVCSFT